MFDTIRVRSAAIGLALLGTLAATPTEAAEVSIAATDATVTMANGVVSAQFRVAASNGEAGDATNLVVVFQDGTQVVVGDVAAGGTATSGPETLTFDVSNRPTRHQTLPVTLRFTLGGQAVEQSAAINFEVQE